MACNSVATSKATIGSIVYSMTQLKEILAKMLGVDVATIVDAYHSEYSNFDDVRLDINGVEYGITQWPQDGNWTLRFNVAGAIQSQSDQELARLMPLYERAIQVARQKATLGKLAQLGKLSNIQQKENGVTARLEIAL